MFSLQVLALVMLVSALSCIDTVTSSLVPTAPCLGKSKTPYLVCKRAMDGTFYNGKTGCTNSDAGSCCPNQVSGNGVGFSPNGCGPVS
ncbi:hypothetical protein MJO28_015932 [Puccinia striiformis f. sp. tritici]|uniref:Uncharacterized protein n=5 Tax=Puccinia striiformis TaxID=27350 RepID=A0A0L0VCQ1_9BASI|nr:hypothetical protein Pst134EA_029033 [Puccinia striiformis f. sp. tritici]KAI9617229.1 hypothetical protein H4Q26_013094 [Puccinia striiformis f. sp. tritici PST-130]KNE97045.1 hypothetical protein PSTG_09620 [Puccinia striiformis f. sp. tritici PST-78]POV94549.1 hypothetical protein PSTT_16802 [Puccinia striiformis]KAH9441083.1 hypothetical protein Pst134EB_029733 [Puccinia striiformis f. sp. tritici]KAH9447047.1 hypothetical protein Pst134EA_029033 [Puccinia striiformis f. sp. tritici]